MVKCQCDEKAELKPYLVSLYDKEKELPFVAHEPHECKCTNELRQYIRKGKKVWLCSCCNIVGEDIEVKN